MISDLGLIIIVGVVIVVFCPIAVLFNLEKLSMEQIGRGIRKLIFDNHKYRTKDGYKAKEYWDQRHAEYNGNILAVGDESYSEQENQEQYQEAVKQWRAVIGNPRLVLEVGYGQGHYAKVLRGKIDRYLGLDISAPVPFEEYGFKFIQADASIPFATYNVPYHRDCDLAFSIDVLQHIVTQDNLRKALTNMWTVLKDGGQLLLGLPLASRTRRHLFYVKLWSLNDIQKILYDISKTEGSQYRFEFDKPFRNNHLLSFRKVCNG